MSRQSVIRSTAVVSAGTAISRILGFAREILMAFFFGTTFFQSAFTVAFTIPNLFRRLFGEGALSAAFIPVFTESLEKEGREEAWKLAGRAMTLLALTLAAIVLAGIVLITIALAFVPAGTRTELTLSLSRIMLPYMLLICLAALCMAVLNSFHHFAVPAATPILLNAVWIITLIFICPLAGPGLRGRIHVLAWGILAAGVIQLLFQIPMLCRYGFAARRMLSWRPDKGVAKVLALMAPAAVGMGVFQINTLLDHLMALAVSDWAAAALRFSERLIFLPMSVFASALGTVLLPVFSRQAARSEEERMRQTLSVSMRNLMLVTMPAAVGLFVLARPIVQLAFECGRFDADSTLQTARALMFYAPGLVVFSLYRVIVPVFYALKDMRTPVRVGLAAVGLNFVLNITFILTWPRDFKHVGLAFATVLSSAFNGAVLGWFLHRRIGSPGWRQIGNSIARILIISLAMGVVARFTHGILAGCAQSLDLVPKMAQLLAVLGSIAAGIVVYGGLAAVLCRVEMRELIQAARRPKNLPRE